MKLFAENHQPIQLYSTITRFFKVASPLPPTRVFAVLLLQTQENNGLFPLSFQFLFAGCSNPRDVYWSNFVRLLFAQVRDYFYLLQCLRSNFTGNLCAVFVSDAIVL